jgi:mannose-6-phosphate isomerase-like protein (cupin superfamily)
MRAAVLVSLAVLLGAGGAAAQDTAGADSLRWGPGPPSLPPGSRLAVVRGDPGKPGPFTMRAALPDGYRIPPHWHPTRERVRVIEGTLLFAHGSRWDDKKLAPLSSGGRITVPAGHRHYVEAKGNTVIEVRSTGPFAVTYVNPADDPRKAATP